jgi:hypothetical protein
VTAAATPSLFDYLTTDPHLLGILSWLFGLLTVLGVWIAIWQIRKVKHAADAARTAMVGLAQRVHSRELLAKLGDAHRHLDAARNQLARSERGTTILCLELSAGCLIEAQEIGRAVSGDWDDLHLLIVDLNTIAERLNAMLEPIEDDTEFVTVGLRLRRSSEILQRIAARSRYAYDLYEEE